MCLVETCGCLESCDTYTMLGYCEYVLYDDEACEPCSEQEMTG